MDNKTKDDDFDLAIELAKFTKKQQLIMETWLTVPSLRSGRSIAEALDMDYTTVCAFINSEPAKKYRQEWIKQNIQWQIDEADYANFLRTQLDGDVANKAYDLFCKRWGLSQTQPNVTVNNTGSQPVMAINILPVSPSEDTP